MRLTSPTGPRPHGAVGEGRFDLDDYVDNVIEMLHELGGKHACYRGCANPRWPVVAAVCRSWKAERDPSCRLSMTLMGGPSIPRRNPTAVNNLAEEKGIVVRNNVISKVPFPHPGFMRDVYPGFLQLNGFITMISPPHGRAQNLFKDLVKGDGDRSTSIAILRRKSAR